MGGETLASELLGKISVSASSVDRWRAELSPEEIRKLEEWCFEAMKSKLFESKNGEGTIECRDGRVGSLARETMPLLAQLIAEAGRDGQKEWSARVKCGGGWL